jgi:membrane protease YdiL (CAAX protease family)
MSCSECETELRDDARFCPSCGKATRLGHRETRAEVQARSRGEDRAGIVLGVIFAGGLLAALSPHIAFGDEVEFGWGLVLVQSTVDILVFVTALLLLRPERQACVAGEHSPTLRALALAIPVGLLGVLVSTLYVEGLYGLLSDELVEVDLSETWPMLFAIVIAAPILEELLCRGAAWQAALELGDERLALILTSILFAILHGANGGFVLEFPHRLAGGFLLGWLRWKTGSLYPSILAHFVWNASAVAISS